MNKVKLKGSMNQCSGCGLVFSSDSAFDRHRVGTFYNSEKKTKGTRRCLTKEEILNLTKTKTNPDKLYTLAQFEPNEKEIGIYEPYEYITGVPMTEEQKSQRGW